MAWKIILSESAFKDMAWFGRKTRRALSKVISTVLMADPLAERRNLKTLRANPTAQRELRILGKYRVLFNEDTKSSEITIVAVGEKRGDRLLVQGQEYTRHHESNPS